MKKLKLIGYLRDVELLKELKHRGVSHRKFEGISKSTILRRLDELGLR